MPRALTNRRDKRPSLYQWGYGRRPHSEWGSGELLSPYAEGDVVDIPAASPAIKRLRGGGPGRYRVVAVFSIGYGDEWYLRAMPIVDGETVAPCSDRTGDRPLSRGALYPLSYGGREASGGPGSNSNPPRHFPLLREELQRGSSVHGRAGWCGTSGTFR